MNHQAAIVPLSGSSRPPARLRWTALPLIGILAVSFTAAATVRAPQLGCSVALVGMVIAAYAARPSAGVAALMLTWLIAPAIRRALGLVIGYLPSNDPLSVAPFLATAAVAVMAAWRIRLPRSVLAVIAVVAAGMVFGLPGGTAQPSAAVFSLLAYLSALSALVVGWSEGRLPLERWTVMRIVGITAPLLAAYAFYQYFVGLPPWDQAWLDSVDFTSIGAPEEGKIRTFASLNSPGLLGVVLALAVLLYTARRGLAGRASAALVLAAGGLAVTYVRSAWLALAAGAVVLLIASGGRAATQVGRLALLLTLGVLALSATGGTYTAIVERVQSFGSLGEDDSAQARTATPAEVLPRLVSRPTGYGLGSAGEATRLASRGGLKAPDNGYLAMAYQLGLLGGLLVVGALLAAMLMAVRGLFAVRDPDRAILAAVLAFFLVALAAGDQFYGLAGVLLWYITGASLARSARPARPPTL